jgi:hypothetical protein
MANFKRKHRRHHSSCGLCKSHKHKGMRVKKLRERKADLYQGEVRYG